MADKFNKKITNARNSNDEFAVEVEEQKRGNRGGRRVSANQIQDRTLRGAASAKNFTTITPQGLPQDLIGDDDEPVQRQQLLVGAKILKNEGARLPPFKPFKTISDEDNIHLLPGETGERARLNLLDTKMVSKKDVQEVKEAYARMRKQYPHLYRKQKEDPHADEKDKKPEEPPHKPEEKKPVPPEEKHEHEHEHDHHHHKPSDTPKPPEHPQHLHPEHPHRESQLQPRPPPQPRRPSGQPQRNRRNIRVPSSSSEESSSSYESSSEESYDGGPDQSKAMKKWYKQYYASQAQAPQGPAQYPGFPGGYSPYNNPYPTGFGPMQGPPCYNPCCEEVQVGKRQQKISVTKRTTERRRLKKPQGLNFDFLPHDDLATEVTMTIEPDDPEPLQYAVENGIMPIICCYMPTSLAVNQQPSNNNPSHVGHSQSSNTYGYGYGSTSKSSSSGSGSGSQSGSGSLPPLGSGGGIGQVQGEASTISS